ncbi:hypothetical protein H7A76_08670 [Pseudomonas sp. MSSRFD41]|uniref:hypothetical protein n=1 Tax=Pseudomonas sp. MSSRFD41 TaxID=1310370 RepID=UPI00163AF313|nr:hypothetical protein [Pseudomonas sp. MSSRFD41]MBC2655510.1 hypothetical protein [Pseudomonas sp. MSSRFD41]
MSSDFLEVPRELLAQALGGEMKDVLAAQRKLRALLAQPAEQPAPAAVVLPERQEYSKFDPDTAYQEGWNACIDEVADLNPPQQ